jgi:DNA-binding transcriptional MerR regulator
VNEAHTIEGYTIEQAAELTGVGRHALRYYERAGVLATVTRGPGGHRRYSDDDLGAIGFVTLLRDTGMPIRDIRRFMDLTRGGDCTIPGRVALLRDHRDAVRARLELETRYLHAIEAKVGVYEALLEPTPEARDTREARGEAR